MRELENLTISKALSLLENREITSLQLTEFYLNKINSSKKLNAFCLTTSELALKQAENCDKINKSNNKVSMLFSDSAFDKGFAKSKPKSNKK